MEVVCQKYQKALEQELGIQLTASSGYMEDTIINHTSCTNFWINSVKPKPPGWLHPFCFALKSPKSSSMQYQLGLFFSPSNLLECQGPINRRPVLENPLVGGKR